MGKYILAWVPLLIIAMINGALRQGWYGRYMSELHAHQLSTLTGIVLFGIYIRALLRYRKPSSSGQALGIGLIWLAMTVAFEFLFMHYGAGHTWGELLDNYNIFAGRVWVLVLVWIAGAPYLFYRLQKQSIN